jgi:gliding motility-associated-like protein
MFLIIVLITITTILNRYTMKAPSNSFFAFIYLALASVLGSNAYAQFATFNGTTVTDGGGGPSCNAGNYKTVNSATLQTNCMRFTNGTFQNGAVWVCSPINLNQSFKITFNINFGTNTASGDGMAFLLQAEGVPGVIGGRGGGLGYAQGDGSNCQGAAGGCPITPSVAVEFDTFDNSPAGAGALNDISADHTSIQTNGIMTSGNTLSGPISLLTSGATVKDGAAHSVCITWDPALNRYIVFFDGVQRMQYNGNIRTIFSDPTNVYWGFTGASGGAAQTQSICSVVMLTNIASPSCSCVAPVATATPNPQTICSGNATGVNLTSSIAGTTFTWVAAANGNVTGESTTNQTGSTITDVLVNSTATAQVVTYTVTPTAAGCTGTAINVPVTVNPLPTITGTLSVCVGLTTQLTGSATAAAVNPWVSSNTAIATVSGTGLVTGVSAGTATITYTNSNGCQRTALVTVNPLPTITGTLTVCVGLTTQLTGSATAAAVNPWVSSNTAVATVSSTGLVTGVSAGTATITYTNTNGCQQTALVTVNPLPTITGTLTVCVGLTTQLTGSATAAAVNPWVSSNTAVATVSGTGLVTGVSAGTATITYTNSNGCQRTALVTVNPLPTITGTLSVCVGLTTQLTGSATAAAVNPWVSSNTAVATVSSTGLVTGVSVGTATITYTNTNGCQQTALVTVNPLPTITGTLSVCVGLTTQLTGSATASAVNPWVSSNTAVATVSSTGLVTGVSAGTATITYTNSNGCQRTVIITVNLNPIPVISPDPAIVCAGDNLQLNGNPIGGSGSYTAHSWSGAGVGSLNANNIVNPIFTNNTSATYALTYTVTDNNGCIGSDNISVIVNAIPVVALNPTPLSVCNATDGEIEVSLLSGPSSSGTVNWTGTTAGTSGLTTLPYDILNLGAGNYNVTFTDANGCISATVVTVLNNPGAPIINAIDNYVACNVPFTLLLSNITGSGLTGNQGYFSGPNGSGIQYDDEHVFPVGTNNVQVYVYDVFGLCAAQISFFVTVNANPTASISPDPATVCEGSSIELNGGPTGGSGVYSGHSWTGDVSVLNATSVVNPSTLTSATANTYNLTYTVTDNNGCVGSDNITVTVNETPVLTVSDPAAVCSPTTVDITASSVSSTTVGTLTYFTDAAFTNPVADPTAVGTGTYYVLASIGTCTDNGSLTVTVTESPILTLNDPASVCSPATIDLTNPAVTSTTIGTLAYYTDAAFTTTVADPTAVGDGTYYVVATNGECTDDGSVTVVVTQTPFLTTNEVAAVCSPLTVDLTDPAVIAGSENVSSLNYFDTDGITPLVSPSAVSVSGTYFIEATNGGCTAFEEVVVTINQSPVLTLNDPASVCSPATVDITDPSVTSTTIGTLAYYTDALFTTVLTNPTAVGNGTYYVVATNGLCTDNGSVTVTVTGTPVLTLNNPAIACSPATVDITNPAVSSTTAGTLTYFTDAAFTSPVADPTAVGAGTYFVVATSGTCSDNGSVTVTINTTPVITNPGAQVACNSYDLPMITGSDLIAAAYYNNSQALGGTVITGPITSTQTVWIYDANGTCTDETSFTVTITPLPTVTGVTGGATYCQGAVVVPIEVAVTGTADWTINYTLNGVAQTATGSASPISLGNAAGTYIVTGLTDAGCSNTASGTQTITVNAIPDAPIAGNDSTYCSAWTLVPMTATGTGGTMTWYSSTGTVLGTGNSFTPSSTQGTTVYYVTETLLGCEGASSEVMITINMCDITTPTAFTPDGDGVNETWQILDLDVVYPDNVVRIYNRWGNLIYEHDSSKDGAYSANAWDGTYKGEALPVGSYYFAIEFNNEDKDTSTGTVTILKK